MPACRHSWKDAAAILYQGKRHDFKSSQGFVAVKALTLNQLTTCQAVLVQSALFGDLYILILPLPVPIPQAPS